MNRIARAKRRAPDGENVDPVPHNVMGPVPSVREQTAALMQDPGWLLQEMRRRETAEEMQTSQVDDFADFDLDMDDDEILTGYEVVHMEPILPPRRPDPTEYGTDSHAAAQEPHVQESDAPQEPKDAQAAHSGSAP